MSKIRFWYAAGACSLAPHILLHEVEASFEGVETDVTPDGARFPPGFEAINPNLRVPVISIDDQVITEVPAISTAISSLRPTLQLMGRGWLETARVHEWMVWLSGTLHGSGFGCLWRPHRYSADPAAYAGIAAKGMQTVRECFAMIETRIVGPFALGDAFTAVDPYLYVFYRWGNPIGANLDRDFPRFAALGLALASRASIVKATMIEKVDPHAPFVAATVPA